jgi:fibronectin type 3 domain-containing protein
MSGGPYTKVTSTPVATTDYTDSSVKQGNTYYYVVTAVNSQNEESGYSAQVSANIP